MMPPHVPDPTTVAGSTVLAPDLLETLASGDSDPVFILVMLLILVLPRVIIATVNAVRDVLVAMIANGREDTDSSTE